MTLRSLTAIALCTAGLAVLAIPAAALAGPNGHANGHAQDHGNAGGNGNGNGSGNGGGDATPHSVVRQYVLANGLKQGDVAKTLKSWNSLNANPKAFANNLDNPNSLKGKQARYICDNVGSQTALASFVALGGHPEAPPTQQQAADAQAFLDALTTLGTDNPQTVSDNPDSYSAEEVAAANLVLGSTLDETSAEAVVDQYAAWTAYQGAAQQATDSFAAASVSYHGATDLSALRTTVDAVIAQKGLDTAALCDTSVAAAQ